MFYVYQIKDPVSNDILYFGQTKDLDQRENDHNKGLLVKPSNPLFKKALYVYWRMVHPNKQIVLEPVFQSKVKSEVNMMEAYLILDFHFKGLKLYQALPKRIKYI